MLRGYAYVCVPKLFRNCGNKVSKTIIYAYRYVYRYTWGHAGLMSSAASLHFEIQHADHTSGADLQAATLNGRVRGLRASAILSGVGFPAVRPWNLCVSVFEIRWMGYTPDN